jgi:hypothetical protein
MSNKKDDIYISLIKFGIDKSEEGVKLSEIKSHLLSLEYKFYEIGIHRIVSDLFTPLNPKTHSPELEMMEDKPMHLTVESTFRWLEYIELHEARQSSKSAMRIAIIAIVISVLTGIFSIYIGVKQMNSPAKFEKEQFKTIENLKYDPIVQDSLLKTIIQNQQNLIEMIDTISKKKQIQLTKPKLH